MILGKFDETVTVDNSHFICLIKEANQHESPFINVTTKQNIYNHFEQYHGSSIQNFMMLS